VRAVETALLLAVCQVGLGYELASFDLIGFSGDGGHLAWEQCGTYDGSGFPYCQVTVMNVPDGSVLQVFSTVIDPDGTDAFPGVASMPDEQTARSMALSDARGLMDSLGIVPGDTGRLCVHRPLTDLSPGNDEVSFATGMYGPGYPASPVFDLVMENREAPGVDAETMEMWVVPPVVLYLAVVERGTGRETVLADETGTADESLYCYGYGLRDVIVWHDRFVVVVLRRSVPGFEGPDTRYRVVTGVLPRFDPSWCYSSTG
jgi:hypothetical protein